MKKLIRGVAVAFILFTVFSGEVKAAEHRHEGFFLRLAPGIGVMNSSEDVSSGTLKASGTSGLFNFAIGGAIKENLILHFDASGVSVTDPTVKLNGASTTANGDFSTSLIGIGLTNYFDSNVYLTAAVGIAKSKFKSNGITYETDNGYGVNLMLGKEWMVSNKWGLGIATQFLYTSCPDPLGNGTETDLNTTSFGVLFSATYN